MDNHMDNMFEKKLQAAMAAPPPYEAFVTGLMKRIVSENSVPQKREIFHKPALHLSWAIPAFLVLIVTILTMAIGPQKVWAAAMKLLGYIPGVGIVDLSAPIRVLAEPVSITRDGVSITVTSATLTGDRTNIDYRTFGIPGSAYPEREDEMGCILQPYLRLPGSTELILSNKDFPPIPAKVNEAILVVPCIINTLPGKVPENWELPLRFIPAPPALTVVPVIKSLPSSTPSEEAGTTTPEINPLKITKALDVGDKFVLMGEFNYKTDREVTLPVGSWWVTQDVSINGADGQNVPLLFSNDFEEPTPSQPGSETWLYQLEKKFVPPVTITYSGEIISPVGQKEQAAFAFNTGANPQEGRVWIANKDYKLGGYNIRLVSIESNVNGYLFHFMADEGASSNLISVDIVGYTPNCGGGGDGGDQYPVEFGRGVCYAAITGGPEFPQGELKVVITFQALSRSKRTFQLQWSPDTLLTGPYITSTPQPGVCLTAESLAQLQPAPTTLSNGKALIYEKLDTGAWGLAVYNLDGSQKQVAAANGNWGALSPDGSLVAYSGSDNGIHIVDLSSQTEKVLPGAGGFNLHWSPDGNQIAYVGMGDGAIDSVFVINTDGTQVRQISNLSYEQVIGWSPDSAKLYYTTPYTGGAAWKVYAFDLTSSTEQELFTIENGTPKFLNPKLSPDGKWIAYRGRDNSSIYLVHPDGSAMYLLLHNTRAVGIEWSRSGWLGVSMRKANSEELMVAIIKPDGCESYLLPADVHGDLEGLFIP